MFFLFLNFILLTLERMGKRKRNLKMKEKHQLLPPIDVLTGDRTPVQGCALTGNQTLSLSGAWDDTASS